MFIYEADGSKVGPVDDYDSLSVHLRYNRGSQFVITLDVLSNDEELFGVVIDGEWDSVGRRLWIPEFGWAFKIEQRQETLSEDGEHKVHYSGRDVGMIQERIIIPPSGSHDKQTAVPAENAMKHYVRTTSGQSASVARAVPNFLVDDDLGRGRNVSVAGRFQVVGDTIAEIGILAGLGYKVYRHNDGTFRLDVIQGLDRSAEVTFSVEYDSIAEYDWLHTLLGRKNWALVAAQGEGELRTQLTKYLGATEPTGDDRQEGFIDARDINDEDASSGILEQRAEEKLMETQSPDSFEAQLTELEASQHGDRWSLGDIVKLVVNGPAGQSLFNSPVRIVEVVFEEKPEGLSVKPVLGSPFPGLKDQLSSGGWGGSSSALV